jgi:alpha-galactosidase
MYSSAGTKTCAGYEGSLDYEEEDAQSFADWGVDYLKYDNCHNQGLTGSPKVSYDRFKKMSDALNKTERPIYYALCNWGEDLVWDWAQDIANAWRITGDIGDIYNKYSVSCPCDGDENRYCTRAGTQCSVMNIMEKAALTEYRGPQKDTGYNDLDMLEVGNGRMSDEAYKTHFSIWAFVKSNFLLGNDIRNMTEDTFSIITNPAIIALNQDDEIAATRVWYYGNAQDSIALWAGPSSNGDQVMALVNGGDEERKMNATLEDILFYPGSEIEDSARKTSFDIYDLWGNRMDNTTAETILSGDADDEFMAKNLYNATETSYKDGLKKNDPKLLGKKIGSVEPMGTINADVPAQGIAIYRLKPQSEKSEL